MQPVLALLALSFIVGLGVRSWNVWTFSIVGGIALAAAAVLYRLDGYM